MDLLKILNKSKCTLSDLIVLTVLFFLLLGYVAFEAIEDRIEVKSVEYQKKWQDKFNDLNIHSFRLKEKNPGTFGLSLHICEGCHGGESYVVLYDQSPVEHSIEEVEWEYKLTPYQYELLVRTEIINNGDGIVVLFPEKSIKKVQPDFLFDLLNKATKRFVSLKEKDNIAILRDEAESLSREKNWKELI